MKRDLWRPVYLALGSNLAQPETQVRQAVTELDARPELRIYLTSSLVQSAPADGSAQPDYINAVVAGMALCTGRQVLEICHDIERYHGRDRTAARWSARTLDIDLLALGQWTSSEPELRVPHPRLAERRFVLQPWSEIAPTFRVPGHDRVCALLASVGGAALPVVGSIDA
ncbi:MAG: 2-amino-4-hydroxy-6-hydroxymethyldihydropteridine diphosphokinase [Pseudomonadota bacterium]